MDFPLPGNGIKCQDWVVAFNLKPLLKEKSLEPRLHELAPIWQHAARRQALTPPIFITSGIMKSEA